MKSILFALVVLACGCIPRCCDEKYVPGVCVTVVDAETGDAVPATVVLTQGGATTPLESFNGDHRCTAQDPCCGGMEGDATLEVSASGYRTWSKTFEVDEDDSGCHPAQVHEDVRLARP